MLKNSQSQQKMFETAPNNQFNKGFGKDKNVNLQSTDNLKGELLYTNLSHFTFSRFQAK